MEGDRERERESVSVFLNQGIHLFIHKNKNEAIYLLVGDDSILLSSLLCSTLVLVNLIGSLTFLIWGDQKQFRAFLGPISNLFKQILRIISNIIIVFFLPRAINNKVVEYNFLYPQS